MRKVQFCAALCLCAFFISCAGAPPKTEASGGGKEKYPLKSFAEKVRLFPLRSAEKPRMVFDFILLETAELGGEQDFFNRVLYAGETPARYCQRLVEQYTDTYRAACDSAETPNPAPESYNWQYVELMYYNRLKERGMVIGRDTYEFTGGAHGLEIKRYYVLDIAAQKQLRLEDFFDEDTMPLLQKIAAELLRQYGDMKGVVYVENPALTENFYINSDGLTLSWQPGEIAAYSENGTRLLLPWREIRPILRHDAMELLEKFGIYMFM